MEAVAQQTTIHTTRILPDHRGTLIASHECEGIWTSQELDPARDAETLQKTADLSFQLIRLLEERGSFTQLYRASMESKSRLREALFAAGSNLGSLNLEQELASAGALQIRLQEYEMNLCQRIHGLIVDLAQLGVYSIRGRGIGISPTTEMKDPLRLEKALAATALNQVRVRDRTGADGMNTVEMAEATGYTIEQITPPGWQFAQ